MAIDPTTNGKESEYLKQLHGLIDDLLRGEPIDDLNRDINGLLGLRDATDMDYCRKVAGKINDLRKRWGYENDEY